MNDILMTKRSSIQVVPNVSLQTNTSMLPSLHLSKKNNEKINKKYFVDYFQYFGHLM